jgi:hypothetical protein
VTSSCAWPKLAERPNVTVEVLPFAAGAHGTAFGAFKILSFPWKVDPAVVYLEYRGGAIYLEQQHEIEAHSLTFQQLCALALKPDESTAMIRTVAGEWGT